MRPPATSPAAVGVVLDDEPLALPAAWTPPSRPPLPLMAAIVPVVGAVVLWLVTGSLFSLWFALLGPVIAGATVLDARRAARRDGRRAAADAARTRESVLSTIAGRHEGERARLWSRHPDVARLVARDGEIWRGGREAWVVVGEGERVSGVRVTGGEGSSDAADVRRRAARVTGAPVTVPLAAGVALVGAETLTTAVQRALVLQLCLLFAPDELRLIGPFGRGLDWMEALPHRDGHGPGLAVIGPGELVPPGAELVIARRRIGEPLPPRCQAVLTITSPGASVLEFAGEAVALRVELVARAQAEDVAAELADRAARSLGLLRERHEPVALAALLSGAPADDGGLSAVIGVSRGDPVLVDLVADGPHAVVAGVTGAGKSELLITWILALCATRSTDEVTFLLADFKGGTAFDALAGVPHVSGVITDLDGSGARRAIESLRAELRRREAAIAAAGARDIGDPRVRLPRLVVVVDEFAALLGDHPELHGLFADLAARGRALGIHLILGTQRAAGVVRDNLLANCPLRISLRVTDAADSRALLGTDDAARLPGGVSGRGTAFVRRAGDVSPQQVRIALSGPDDVAAASARIGVHTHRRPWLPELPRLLTLAELADRSAADREAPPPGSLLLGLADEPEHQRQPVAYLTASDRGLLVLGGPASGVSNALDLIAAQRPAAVVRVPAHPEALWDAVAALHDGLPPRGSAVLIDDLDAITLRLPAEYAQIVLERVEGLARRAADAAVLMVVGAHRLTGPVSRVADLFPRRLLLPYATRVDHASAGGDPSTFDTSASPGRGRLDSRPVQLARAPAVAVEIRDAGESWAPSAQVTGLVARRSPVVRAALAAWEQRGAVVVGVDDYAADPSAVGAGRVVAVGEPEDWQRHWRLLADIRGDHDLVVDTSCASELRVLAGFRGVPPYCEPGAARAWLISAGAELIRIVLPRADVRPDRRSGALTSPSSTA